MIKICPECLNVNGSGAVCKTCGFPLEKKIIGKFEDYYFYDAIELYNLGHHADAENRIREKQKTLQDPKLTLLIEKFDLANNLIKRAEDSAERSLNQLRQGNFHSALAEIKSATDLYVSPRFTEIEQQIQRAQAEKESRDKAHTLAEDSKQLFVSGSPYEAIRTMQEALKLAGNKAEYKAEYDRQVEATVEDVSQQVRVLLTNGDYKGADSTLQLILPFAATHPVISSLVLELNVNLDKQAKKKRTTFGIAAVLISAVVIGAGWYIWQNNQKKNAWETALTDGSLPVIEAFIQNNPDSKYLPDAILKLSELKSFDSSEWLKANQYITSASMQTYLNSVRSIKGLYMDRATAIIDSIDWFAIEKSENAYQYENYISTHPNSQYIPFARGKLSEQVTASERDNLMQYVTSYYSTFSNGDFESLMLYFEPITPVFGSRKNISKADLRVLFESDRKSIESISITIDPSSFKVRKDENNNYFLNFYADTYTTRIAATEVMEEESQPVEFFSNVDWFITLNKDRKITSYKYNIISEKQINQ